MNCITHNIALYSTQIVSSLAIFRLVFTCSYYKTNINAPAPRVENDASSRTLKARPSASVPGAAAMSSPQRFQGSSLVQWNNPAAVVTVPWHVEMMFRTRQPSSVLLRVTAGQQHSITLQVQR